MVKQVQLVPWCWTLAGGAELHRVHQARVPLQRLAERAAMSTRALFPR
jgi:hypothetical protein